MQSLLFYYPVALLTTDELERKL